MEQNFDGQDAGAFYAANRIEELAGMIDEKDARIADLESKYYNSFTTEMVEGIVAEKKSRIAELEADNFKLRCIASEALSESFQLDAARKTRIAELEAQIAALTDALNASRQRDKARF